MKNMTETLFVDVVKWTIIGYGGGGLEFLPGYFYLFCKGDRELYFFHLGMG